MKTLSDVNLPIDQEYEDNDRFKQALTHAELLGSYRVAEVVTLAHDCAPVCWPLAPELQRGRLVFSTGYMYPTKARNASRNPRVAALFSDPTASGRSVDDPLVLVQGLAEVFDQDLQRNTERYVDQLLRKGPLYLRLVLRTPSLRQLLVGYLARIWIEVVPQQEYVWRREQVPPGRLRSATRPVSFSPGPGMVLPPQVYDWLLRYPRNPVLGYIDQAGWPAMTRVKATLESEHISIDSGVEPNEGAPACLTYHRLVGNYLANDAFLIRGHFNSAGRFAPEKVVGYGGTHDDRGLGSMKLMRFFMDLRRQLLERMEKEARPVPVVRPTPRSSARRD